MVHVEFDYSKLRGRIKEKYSNEGLFAKSLGLSSVSLGSKLNNKVGFKSQEIKKTCDLLSIEPEEIKDYFFTLKTKKTS